MHLSFDQQIISNSVTEHRYKACESVHSLAQHGFVRQKPVNQGRPNPFYELVQLAKLNRINFLGGSNAVTEPKFMSSSALI